MMEIISLGCRSEHPDGTKSKGEINQIDRSGRKLGPWKIYADRILIAEGSYLEGESDLFILHTPSDTVLTMAIGYIPDLTFKDLRNLVREVDFKIR
jgi:hypothetical protein